MAKVNPLERIRIDTEGLKADLLEQVATLEKLKSIGEQIGELTDADDPFQEVIAETVESVKSMTRLAERLAKIKLPE